MFLQIWVADSATFLSVSPGDQAAWPVMSMRHKGPEAKQHPGLLAFPSCPLTPPCPPHSCSEPVPGPTPSRSFQTRGERGVQGGRAQCEVPAGVRGQETKTRFLLM